MIIQFHSNNSGGNRWLNDDNWLALEKAGWKLFSFGDFVYEGDDYSYSEDGLPERKGGKATNSMGTLAHYAFKKFDSMKEAIIELEKLTGLDSTEEGCNCCGPPHCFSSVDSRVYCSGEGILPYLYPESETNKSKRELIEEVNRNDLD